MANPSGFYTCPKCGRLNAGAYTRCVCDQDNKEQTACRLDNQLKAPTRTVGAFCLLCPIYDKPWKIVDNFWACRGVSGVSSTG